MPCFMSNMNLSAFSKQGDTSWLNFQGMNVLDQVERVRTLVAMVQSVLHHGVGAVVISVHGANSSIIGLNLENLDYECPIVLTSKDVSTLYHFLGFFVGDWTLLTQL